MKMNVVRFGIATIVGAALVSQAESASAGGPGQELMVGWKENSLLAISLSPQPTARVRARVDCVDADFQTDVEWDPIAPDHAASHDVVIPKTCKSGVRVSVPFDPEAKLDVPTGDPKNTFKRYYLVFRKESEYQLVADFQTVPETTAAVKGVTTLRARWRDYDELDTTVQHFNPIASGGNRAFEETLGEYGKEALQIIAEIAIEHARSRAFALVSDMLGELCAAAKWPEPNTWNLHGDVLPKTCETLSKLDLRDVAGAGQSLGRSLAEDLVSTSTRALEQRLLASRKDLTDDQRQLMRFILTHTGELMTGFVVRGKLEATALDAWLVELASQTVLSDDVRIAIAAVAKCTSTQPCSVRSLLDIVHHPQDQFKTSVREGSAKSAEIALLLLDIVQPVTSTSTKDRAKNVLRLSMVLLRQLLDVQPNTTSQRALDRVEALGDGVLDGDARRVLQEGGALIVDQLGKGQDEIELKNRVDRATRIFGAIVSYARSLPLKPDGTVDEKAGADYRDARKKAIEDVIDASTDRRNREDDVIVSLGVSAGFVVGGRFYADPQAKPDLMSPQLTLPMGVAIDGVPGSNHVGFHFLLSAIDLAQYAAYRVDGTASDPRGDSWLTIGLEGGVLLGKPNSAVFLGLDLRYSPALFPSGDHRGAGSLGIALGYYLPLFDFN